MRARWHMQAPMFLSAFRPRSKIMDDLICMDEHEHSANLKMQAPLYSV